MTPPTPASSAPPGATPAGRKLLARAALALYPPAWRARYGDEVSALLDDSGGGLAAAASVAWRALPAWICPPRHLHDRPARMRASLATALLAWSMLAGLGLVFAPLTQLQSLMAPGYAEVRWAHAVFDGSLALSALAAGLGGLPLWLLMLRRARREQRARDTLYLLLPVLAPMAYLAGLAVTVKLAGGPNGESLSWFLAVTPAGFAAAAIAAAGPGLALRRLQPRGPALHLAAGGRGGRDHGGGGRGHRGRRGHRVPVGAPVLRLPQLHHPRHLPGPGRRRRIRHHSQRRPGRPRRTGGAIAAPEAAAKAAPRRPPPTRTGALFSGVLDRRRPALSPPTLRAGGHAAFAFEIAG